MSETQTTSTPENMIARMRKLQNRINLAKNKLAKMNEALRKRNYRELILIDDCLYVKDSNNCVYDILNSTVKIGLYKDKKLIMCNVKSELEEETYL
jgi:hypothetical protein